MRTQCYFCELKFHFTRVGDIVSYPCGTYVHGNGLFVNLCSSLFRSPRGHLSWPVWCPPDYQRPGDIPRGVLKVQRLSPRGRKGVPKTGSLRQISHGAWTAAGITRPERVAAGGASARPPDRGHNVSRAASRGPPSTSRKHPAAVTVSTPRCVHVTSRMHTGGGAWPRARGRPGACARGARARGHERLQHVGALHATLPAEQDQ